MVVVQLAAVVDLTLAATGTDEHVFPKNCYIGQIGILIRDHLDFTGPVLVNLAKVLTHSTCSFLAPSPMLVPP